MTKREPASLYTFFRKQAIRWSFMSLGMILFVAIPGFLWVMKTTSEKRVVTLAQATAKAFRSDIIDGHIREAQDQIAESLKLKGSESAVVRDPSFQAIYNNGKQYAPVDCKPPVLTCWVLRLKQLQHLEPIYFDANGKELFGYLDLRLDPIIDKAFLWIFLALIPVIFLIQALGLSSALENSAREVTSQLGMWSRHLREAASESTEKIPAAPFIELKEMQCSIDGLQFEIKKYQKLAVDEAKSGLQLSILKEVSHDLRTPLSQLTKLFAVFISSSKRTGAIEFEQVKRIERTLLRVGNIARQVKTLQMDLSHEVQECLISEETEALMQEFRSDPEVEQKQLKIVSDLKRGLPIARVSPTAYQRIFDNLLRNAIDASQDAGEIRINIFSEAGNPTLFIQDFGHGIAEDIQSRIFDFDFTTKSSRGTGLGLSITRQLCNIYGAHIFFETKVNQGSLFKVSFLPVLNHTECQA